MRRSDPSAPRPQIRILPASRAPKGKIHHALVGPSAGGTLALWLHNLLEWIVSGRDLRRRQGEGRRRWSNDAAPSLWIDSDGVVREYRMAQLPVYVVRLIMTKDSNHSDTKVRTDDADRELRATLARQRLTRWSRMRPGDMPVSTLQNTLSSSRSDLSRP